ncbi:MAG TPA: hypothetical protein VEH10_05145, partial [Thermoplasmata archaeon]|nr:hypothetical protein [Thermoplasmata archaeon]
SYYYFLTHPQDWVAEWRRSFHDPMVFAEFEWLCSEMGRLDVELTGAHSLRTRFEDSRGVLLTEASLDHST